MKKSILLFFFAVISIVATAQVSSDFTLKFMGIPVDGTKSKMISELKKKGFTYNYSGDYLSGKFNGKNVNVFVSTNNDKVDRVFVSFPETDEASIRIEYNILLSQFENNEKYVSMEGNEEIPSTEDISYEILVHKKRYDAGFYYMPPMDSTQMVEQMSEILLSKYSPEQIAKMSDEDAFIAVLSELFTGNVWFTIFENYGGYNIGLYYDNLKNRPNGEDL